MADPVPNEYEILWFDSITESTNPAATNSHGRKQLRDCLLMHIKDAEPKLRTVARSEGPYFVSIGDARHSRLVDLGAKGPGGQGVRVDARNLCAQW